MDDKKQEAAKGLNPVAEPEVFGSMDEILDVDDVRYAIVPAWGKRVRIGSLSAGDMLDFVESNEGPAKRTAGLRLIIQSLVDKDGKRIGDIKKLDQLKKKDADITNKLVGHILKLNGMDEAARKVLGNDSSEAPSGASPTV